MVPNNKRILPSFFDSYPFLRLLLPLIGGILFENQFGNTLSLWLPLSLGALLLYSISLIRTTQPLFRFSSKTGVGLALLLLFFSGGMLLYRLTRPRLPLPDAATYPQLCLQPQKELRWNLRSVSTNARLIAAIDTMGHTHTYPLHLQLYFEPTDSLLSLEGNRLILIPNRLKPLTNTNDSTPQNSYLLSQGISATTYLPKNGWRFLPDSLYRLNPLEAQLFRYRKKARNIIEKSGLRGDESALLTALCIGNREKLSPLQREAFAASGLSHLLSISGLHISILAALLSLLLYPIRRLGYRKTSIVVLLFGIWAYTLFCGASYPALRASLTATLFGIGMLLERRNYSLNTLFAAAFLILLFTPEALFNVGFQLSFVAVAAILLLYVPIARAFKKLPPVGRYLASLFLVTLSVQIGTLLLIVSYTQTLSWASIGTNMLVTPLLPLIMIGGFLVLCIAPFGALPESLLYIENSLLRWINLLAFKTAPTAIPLAIPDVLLPYLFLLLFGGFLVALYFYNKRTS